MESIAKIRFKAGSVEIEYEGSADYLDSKFESLVETLMEMAKDAPVSVPNMDKPGSANGGSGAAMDFSTNTIATTLGSKTGSDLVIAAAAKLALVDRKAKFTRKEISEEMKTATTFYKQTFTNNLSSSLAALVKVRRLHLQAANQYALSTTELKSLEAKLVN